MSSLRLFRFPDRGASFPCLVVVSLLASLLELVEEEDGEFHVLVPGLHPLLVTTEPRTSVT